MARSDQPRDTPRRGAPDVPRRRGAADGERVERPGGRGGLADARRYSPRGRTLREQDAARASADRVASRDLFRPALQVLNGGRAAPRTGAAAPRTGAAASRTGAAPRKAATESRAANPPRKAATRTGAPRWANQQQAGRQRAGQRRANPQRRPAVRRKVNLAPPRPGRPQGRLRVATVLVLTMFVLIAGRLFVLQFTDAKAYAAEGLRDRLTTEIIAAARGSILDRDGKILAHSVEARYIYADPAMVVNVETTAEALAPLLGRYGVARSELVTKLTRHKRKDGTEVRFEYLARGVDIETGDAVEKLNLAGVRARPDERREVPGHDLAASVIGFTGRDLTGLTGLEAAYNQQLRGAEGKRVYEKGQGNLNREIPGGVHQSVPAKPGTSLQLTIDRYVQFEVQRILAKRLEEVKATTGAAVVMDIQTGEVIAQASYPGYDAVDPGNDPEKRIDTSSGLVVDPGSTHKAIVIGAALQEGVITPETSVSVGPGIVRGDRRVTDTHPFSKETPITLAGLLAYSSNIGTVRIADQLGADKLYEYQRRFGLGEPTGVGLPGEAPGEVRAPRYWSGTSYGTIPIGNGVATTPLQMAAVFACIANGGQWVQPHLIRGTVDTDGKLSPAAPPRTRQVLDRTHADTLRGLLEAPVTVKGGTAPKAAVPGYRVAGKTGTGGRVVDGKYVDGYVASFIGFAPADAPRYVIAVYSHAPTAMGGAMAPAFSQMMAFTLTRFKVPPTGTLPPAFRVHP